MLPNRHYPADSKWLSEQLAKLPTNIALETCGKYSAAYRDAFDDELLDHKKGNAGRKAANTRLREFVEAYSAWR